LGFQANNSAQLILQGDLFGDGAIWKRVVGPVLAATFGMTSSPIAARGILPLCDKFSTIIVFWQVSD
jgi:hypothetical protein